MSNEIFRAAIQRAWETGHFWSPENPEGVMVRQQDLDSLTPSDPVAVQALISMSRADSYRYTRMVLDIHGRQPHFDGEAGPAMAAFIDDLDSARCPVPDHAPPPGVEFHFNDPDLQRVVERMQRDQTEPAVGAGNWSQCHEVHGFHCVAIGVNDVGLPQFLSPLFTQVLTNVRKAYAGIGLLIKFISKSGRDILTGEDFSGTINIEMAFVSSSDGWIGLAIVGKNETCTSRIWCKFLSTYKGGSTNDAIVTQWTTLIKHEIGHNCGRSHTSGGVMNPSIVNGLPVEWTDSDPSTTWMKQQFGGVPVPIPGYNPPPNTPAPPSTLEDRVRAMEVKNTVQDVTIDWCVRKIKSLGG